MKKVLTVGVFDYFHLGHLRLFKNAKALGDYLIVAVHADEYILATKPNAQIFYSTEERMEILEALEIVDEVIIYESVDTLVPEVDFDVFAIGGDQVHEGFQRAVAWCEANGKEVVRMPRTEGVCSSEMKNLVKGLK